jgi:hypothetical protein
MTAGLFDSGTLAALRVLNEENLPFTVQLSTLAQVQNEETAEFYDVWIPEPAQPCRLAPASAGGTNLRADQPSAAGDWALVLKVGSAVVAGQQALVRGQGWQRLLQVERVVGPRANEMMTKVFCTDVELNP